MIIIIIIIIIIINRRIVKDWKNPCLAIFRQGCLQCYDSILILGKQFSVLLIGRLKTNPSVVTNK